jgi:hypothetical protein
MTRSILAGLLGILSIAAVGALPLACQSGGIGDPCIPEDEYNADFAGFKVTEENIESRSFQCSTRICLVNHFQGRVTCPLGQLAPTACRPGPTKGHDKGDCMGEGEICMEASVNAPDCVPPPASCKVAADCPGNGSCVDGHCPEPCSGGLTCDPKTKVCSCTNKQESMDGSIRCLPSIPTDVNSVPVLKTFVCHKPGNCQAAGADPKTDTKKDCCVPGTDTPTTSEVCGQCTGTSAKKSARSGDQSVYCSCRCGVADGATDPEPNFNFCECPTGFSCEQVRPAVGLGDTQLTGKYCVKEGTKYFGKTNECLEVFGNKGATCDGLQK